MKKSVVGFVIAILVLVGVTTWATWPVKARQGPPRPESNFSNTLDQQADRQLVVTGSARTLHLVSGQADEALGVNVVSAQFGADVVFYVTRDFSLMQWSAKDGVQQLLPPGSANGPLRINAEMDKLAYTKPFDLPAENMPDTNGVAVYDLRTGQEKVLAKVEKRTINLFGWDRQDLLVEMPPYQPTLDIAHLTLDGRVIPIPEFTGRIPKTADAVYPRLSFDRRYLAYETKDGLHLINIAARTDKLVQRAAFSAWQTGGIEVTVDGRPQVVAVP